MGGREILWPQKAVASALGTTWATATTPPVHSSQANDACKCNGWKNPNPPTAPRMDLQQPVTNLSEPCRSCGHALGNSCGASRAGKVVLIPQSHCGFSPHSGPRVPPGERLRGRDQQTAGHGGGCGEPLHVSAQGGGHGHQAGVFLPVQGASEAVHVSLPCSRGDLCRVSGQCGGAGAAVPLFVLCWSWH